MVNLAENNAVSRAGELQSQGFSDAQIYEALRNKIEVKIKLDSIFTEMKAKREVFLNEVEQIHSKV